MDTERKIVKIHRLKDFEKVLKNLSKIKYELFDLFPNQVEELVEIRLVGADAEQKSQENTKYLKKKFGSIVYFPWRKSALRILDEDDFVELFTSRNKNLITETEQNDFYNFRVSIAGMSVGSNIASTVVMQGGGRNITIADPDILSTSNLNRVRFNLFAVTQKKTLVSRQQLQEINPYVSVKTYSDGLDSSNLDKFLSQCSICFDEIDNLNLKLKLRLAAKKKKIPVVMITDNGDNIIIDIERYDQKNNLRPFHGLLSDQDIKSIMQSGDNLSPRDKVILSLKIVQPQNAVSRMQDSLLEVGKTIKTWPQIGTAATVAGAVGSYIVKRLACADPLLNGRLHLSIDSGLIPGHRSINEIKKREEHTKKFLNKLSTR